MGLRILGSSNLYLMTLTNAAYYIRKSIIFGGIGFLVLMIGTLSFMSYLQTVKTNTPIPTPTPSASFGKLPPLIFPENGISRPANFELELIEGRPPEATHSAPIYLIPDKKPTLFSKRQAVTFGKKVGFLEEPREISATILDFTDPGTNSTLTVNIATNNFYMKKNYPDTTPFQTPTITDETTLVSHARGYFRELRLWNDSFTSSAVSYFSFDGTNLFKLPDARDATVARVDFFAPSFGPYPTVTSYVTTSDVYLVFTADRSDILSVVEASFQYFPADINISSTYPTISGQQAFEELQSGKGHIASSNTSNAVIRKVYLAYYVAPQHQDFLQLVWVFEGDDGFAALVPAIDPYWRE